MLEPLFGYVPVLFTLIALVVCFIPDPRREIIPVDPPAIAGSEMPDARERPLCARNMTRFFHAYFLYLFAYTGSAAYLSLYLKSLGATPMWLTGVFAAGVICEVLVMSQVGRLSDRFGRRPLLALSFALMPLRLLLYIPAMNSLWVMGVQTLHGLNFGVMAAVSVAFISDLCDEGSRGRMQARMAATSGIASALGPATGGWIAQQFGIRWTFGIMACVAAAGAAVFIWRVRESHPSPVRLYRVGPARLLPMLQVMCLPLGRLSRRWVGRSGLRWSRQPAALEPRDPPLASCPTIGPADQ
jgi:MFS family permease